MNIYLLYACDDWKQNDSMRLFFVGTSRRKLNDAIFEEVEEAMMSHDKAMDEDGYFAPGNFHDFLMCSDINDIENGLMNGHIEVRENNQNDHEWKD